DYLLSIATLGFRGEALPTIAAVSRLLLETRDEAEAEGTRIEFAGGKLVNVRSAGLPVGTTISVADIFYCVPARRKFLKADTTEPELEPQEEKSSLTVSGFTSRPDIQRMNRNGIYVFVNRRLVRDRLILHAIHEAYRNILPPGVFPATLLFLEMPYAEVDVNVHPAKIEVRFRRSQLVHDFARDAIRQALTGARPIASFAAAAAATPQTAGSGNGRFSGGITPATVESGVPRAIIPPVEEVGSDGGFDLTRATLGPVEQRIPFTSATAFG